MDKIKEGKIKDEQEEIETPIKTKIEWQEYNSSD